MIATMTPATSAPTLPRWPYPRWIAHRGGGTAAPENTLAGFRLGAARGYRMAECDVRLSADGVPFLFHDDTLERTGGRSGLASALAWAEASRLDAGGWQGKAYAGEPPASLEAVLRFCLANRLALNIEIKPAPGQADATARAVCALLSAHWPTSTAGSGAPVPPPLLSSFETEALQAAREALPEAPRALLVQDWRTSALEDARALDCLALFAEHRLWDEARVALAHASGLRTGAYTVNDDWLVRHLWALGIDAVFTDRVERFEPTEAWD